tara:strand:+ start:436 stop:594 length:159 start_codon:yes stop_codon:yes gene_type:complete
MPKDPKTKAELSYESLSSCLQSAESAEGAIACETYFQSNAPEKPKVKAPKSY